MKISIKFLLLFFAVSMMSIVACSDDDSDDPAPSTGNGSGNGNGNGNGGGDQFTVGIFAVVNQDSVDFTNYSATLDNFTSPSVVRIVGRDSNKTNRIDIVLAKNYTGTADASKPTSNQTVTFEKDGTPFSPSSGTITVTQNDTIVEGTFEFEGSPAFGSDTLSVMNGKFKMTVQ